MEKGTGVEGLFQNKGVICEKAEPWKHIHFISRDKSAAGAVGNYSVDAAAELPKSGPKWRGWSEVLEKDLGPNWEECVF